jgi:hypothetical protein
MQIIIVLRLSNCAPLGKKNFDNYQNARYVRENSCSCILFNSRITHCNGNIHINYIYPYCYGQLTRCLTSNPHAVSNTEQYN